MYLSPIHPTPTPEEKEAERLFLKGKISLKKSIEGIVPSPEVEAMRKRIYS